MYLEMFHCPRRVEIEARKIKVHRAAVTGVSVSLAVTFTWKQYLLLEF